MLLVPMTYEDHVHGVVVVSKTGRDRFDARRRDDPPIFAGYAAQALVNATNLGRLQRQQAELEHQLVSQRRLLEVNERLLSTLDPNGVLELIADSLKAIVPYDSLTIYRVDRETGRPPRGHRPRPVRRADPRLREPARRRHHRLGGRPRRGRPRQRGAPRSALGPDPGHAVRAGVDDRRPAAGRRRGDRHAEHRPDGRRGGLLQPERVRAHPALRRPGLDRPPERRGPRRGTGPRRARRADRAAQPRRVPARAGRAVAGDRRGPARSRS